MHESDRLPDDLERETRALRRVARGILFEPALAEDAVQEAWLAALRARPARERSGGWLNEAVRRIASGLRRSEARRGARERGAARSEAQPSAADGAVRVELLRELLDALESLEEPYRSAVQLRLLENLPPRAIAARLGLPVETVRTRIKRGLEKLRARLDARNAHRRGEFLAALAPLALPAGWKLGAGAYLGTKTIFGGLMSTQAKLSSAAAVVLLLAGLFWIRPWAAGTRDGEQAPGSVPAVPEAAAALAEDGAGGLVQSPIASSTALEPDRRVLDAEPSAWIVRGRAKVDGERSFPGVDVQIEVTEGYEGPGECLRVQTVRTDDAGGFALALPQPDRAVRVGARATAPGYLCYRSQALVLRGAAAPQDLEVALYTLDLMISGRVLDLQGAPIRGAHVNGTGWKTIETDAQGTFEVQACSALGSARVDAWADGFSEACTSISAPAPGRIEGVELRLAPQCVLQGRVIDESGRGIADARVRCMPLGHAETRTARDGSFTLAGLPSTPKWLSIGASAAGYATARQELREGHLPAEGLVLTLLHGVQISGQVVDEAGRPLPGAQLYTGSSRYDIDALRAIAGDEGRFTIADAALATSELHAECGGFAPGVLALTIPEHGRLAPVRIALGRGLSLSGTAVDAQQNPVPGLRVSALHLRGHDYVEGIEAQTGPDGRFALANLPRADDLGIELFGKGFVRRSLPIDPAALGDLRVVMERSAGLAGRVVDAASGKPVTTFRVRIVAGQAREGEALLGGYESSWAEAGHEFHDPDGRWNTRGEDLAPGQLAGLEVRAPGYSPAFVARAMTSARPEDDPIVIRLGAGADLRGRVVDRRDGAPIAGARVRRLAEREARGPWEPREADARDLTLTDANGAFRFDGLAPGKLWLAAEAAGFAPLLDGPIEFDAATPERSLALVTGASLRGVLRDAAGRAQANATISVSAGGGQMGELYRTWTLETDADGRFELRDLMPARYSVSQELHAERAVVHDLTQQVLIAEARTHEVELQPRGTCSIVGTIAFHGAPAPLLTIEAWPAGGAASIGRGALARDGQFALEGLEPGRWDLRVWEPGSPQHARSASAQCDVAPGHATTITIELAER